MKIYVQDWETIQSRCVYFSKKDKKCRVISKEEYEEEPTFKECRLENCIFLESAIKLLFKKEVKVG